MLRHSLVLTTLLAVACTLPVDRALGPGEIRATIVRGLEGGAFEPVEGAVASIEGTRLRATSDASGNVVLRNVPVGTHDLRVLHRASDGTEIGARIAGIELEARGDGTASGRHLGRVVLEALGAIEGVVLENGTPRANAVVGARHTGEVRTDAEGRFTIPRLARGAYELGVAVTNGDDRVLHATYAADVKPRETTQATLELTQLPSHGQGTVSGLAVQLGNPDWSGIEAWLERPGERVTLPLGRTDADGRYVSESPVAPGVYTLRARAPDGALASRAGVFVMGDTAFDPLYLALAAELDDDDEDLVLDTDDNCSSTPNHAQENTDGDGTGDVCDEDLDGDGVPNPLDFSIEPVTPTELTGTVGEALPAFVVRVRNAWNEPAPGRTVAFEATSGTVSLAEATTTADGLASVEFTPAHVPGPATVTATTSPERTATFDVDVRHGAPERLVLQGFTAPVKATLTRSVTVEALDAYGNRTTAYTGSLALAASDTAATWPAGAAFTLEDQGLATVPVTFATPGTHTLEVQLADAVAVRGVLENIAILAAPRCGDTDVDAEVGETCDDANDVTDPCAYGETSCTVCTATCVDGPGVTSFCGDAATDAAHEQCDDGNDSDTDLCTTDCLNARCGDGFAQPGEECDDANPSNTDLCTNVCRNARCGDGYTQPGEQCDDANDDELDACRNDCSLPVCGDGKVSYGEECDDANDVETDACSTACRFTRCNGTIVWPATDPSPVVTVTSLADAGAGSLRDALAAAPAGATVLVTAEGTITLASELLLTKNVTIRGPGRGKLTLDGVDAVRLLRISTGVTVSVSGLTLFRGRSLCNGGCTLEGLGGCVYNQGTATFVDVTARQCMAGDGTNSGRGGGAFFNATGATLLVASSDLQSNTANYRTFGGAAFNLGRLDVCRVRVTGNTVVNGPGAAGIQNHGTLVVEDSYFASNSNGNDAGAALAQAAGTTTVRNTTFTANAGSFGAGTIHNLGGGAITLESCTIVGNSLGRTGTRGGAIGGAGAGGFRLRNTIVAANSSSAGANDDVAGTIVSLGNNVIGSVNSTTGWVASDRTGTIAAPLDLRRGATVSAATMPVVTLLQDSPALDTANASGLPAFDVRGRPRVQVLPDVGAFESAMPTFAAVTPTPEPGRLTVLVDVDPHGRGALVNVELAADASFAGARSSTARAGAGSGPRQLAVAFENVPAGTWNLRVTATNVDGQRRTTPVEVVIP